MVCSLLLPCKPVATDNDEHRGFTRSRRCPGSHHLLLLLHHRLGEFSFRGGDKLNLLWAQGLQGESGAWFGEVSPGGQRGALLGNSVVLQIETELVVWYPGRSAQSPLAGEFRTSPSPCVPIENVSAATSCPHFGALGATWLELNESPGADHCSELVSWDGSGMWGALGSSAPPRGKPGWFLLPGHAETPFAPTFWLCAPPVAEGRLPWVQNPARPLVL